MDFVTCGQMKILEKRADKAGLSYYQMMENAGAAAANTIANIFGASLENTRSIIFCGKGNNGGDGFVVGRKLLEQGSEVTVILVDGLPVTDESKKNLGLLEGKVQIVDMTKSASPFLAVKGSYEIIVDALYGTGFRGSLNPNALKSAAFIKQSFKTAKVFALDIPSGVGGDVLSIEKIDSNAVRAHYTITFHNKKPVHIQSFAETYCGEIVIVDIGIDEEKLW